MICNIARFASQIGKKGHLSGPGSESPVLVTLRPAGLFQCAPMLLPPPPLEEGYRLGYVRDTWLPSLQSSSKGIRALAGSSS
jgi:hypothetical protein